MRPARLKFNVDIMWVIINLSLQSIENFNTSLSVQYSYIYSTSMHCAGAVEAVYLQIIYFIVVLIQP